MLKKIIKTSALFSTTALLCTVTHSVNANTVLMQKQGTSFAIDGGVRSSRNGLEVYLWNTSTSNINQNWIETSRGGNLYSYQKANTNLCLDGGNNGRRRQPVTLESCNASNGNQQWRKIRTGRSRFRLEKSNAPGFSIDGNNGAEREQGLYLWNSDSNNNF